MVSQGLLVSVTLSHYPCYLTVPWSHMAVMRVGMQSWCALQVYFWPMEVKFGPMGSQVMKKKKIFK